MLGMTNPNHYWSSTTHGTTRIWDVDFDDGWVESHVSKGSLYYVRAVRAGL